ncbi:hypothetical protein ACX3YC_13700 [Pseudomonas mohnii]
MDSKAVKSAFAEAGIKVRVKTIQKARGITFRVCRLGEIPHDKELSISIAARLGLVDCFGNLGGNFNAAYEMYARTSI